MTDLHGWITQQVDTMEAVAREATEGPWFADHPEPRHWGDDPESALIVSGKILCILDNQHNGPLNADHIVLHSPDNVLRRCAADRKILAAHPVTRDVITVQPDGTHGFGCATCHQDEGLIIGDGWCDTLLALAEAHGWTGTNTNSKENEA